MVQPSLDKRQHVEMGEDNTQCISTVHVEVGNTSTKMLPVHWETKYKKQPKKRKYHEKQTNKKPQNK